jgi:hypothetical protein
VRLIDQGGATAPRAVAPGLPNMALLPLLLLAASCLSATSSSSAGGVDTNLWGITGWGAKTPLALASVNAASGAAKPSTGAESIDCGVVVQEGSAIDPVKRIFYNVALNCTDPESGSRAPEAAGVYWLVGLSLATGKVVVITKLPLLLPFHPIGPFGTPGQGITIATDHATGDVFVFGPVQLVKLPPGPPGGAGEGPLMLLQRLVGGPDADDGSSLSLSAFNVTSAVSASTIVGVDATFGDGVFFSFITPINTTGINLVSVDTTQDNARFKDLGEALVDTADWDHVTKQIFGLGEVDSKRILMSVDPSSGASKKIAEVADFTVEWGSDATLDPTLRMHYSLLCPNGGGGGGCASSDFHLIQINLDDGGVMAHPTECATPNECTLSMEVEALPSQ